MLKNSLIESIEYNLENGLSLNKEERNFLLKKGFSESPSIEDIAFLKQSYYFKGANPTADCLVILNDKILLVLRDEESVEANKWAIPGGFVDTKAVYGQVWQEGLETPLQAAVRELSEEANCNLDNLVDKAVFLKLSEGNGRDPRDNALAWSKSYAFVFDLKDGDLPVEKLNAIRALDEVTMAQWHDVDNLPLMAFDHKEIINFALEQKKQTIDKLKFAMKK